MRTYQVDLTSEGIGLQGLILFSIAIVIQMILYVLCGAICFIAGFIMFIVGGLFGRSVQKHYDKDQAKDVVGVPMDSHRVLWYRKLLYSLFPVLWVMDGVSSHSFVRLIGFSNLHLTGGDY